MGIGLSAQNVITELDPGHAADAAGELWPGDPPEPDSSDARDALMPRRRQTRAQNRIRAIAAERKLNEDRAAEHNKPPPF